MASIVRHPKNFWIGIIFLCFGIAAIALIGDNEMGSAGRMGPGYFPTVLGGLLSVVGLAGIIRAFIGRRSEAHDAIGTFHIKDIVIILGAVILFGILMRGAGLPAAAFVLVMLSSFASKQFSLKGSLLLAVGLAIFSVLLFVKLLGLPMPIVGPWLGGA
ncbi:tripartite tricarboxylate transporter TctB family protein [Massilia alkalitolerans]|uniref:tripartite tricarboxylate transporter TctB family protein n=1 Tax=Massilia alkalitolerans TaxID=286638 RepID=UPI00042941EC|nr:tripartite tricarboxylate transporter TctB family protein [Massilia alkalitolerans]